MPLPDAEVLFGSLLEKIRPAVGPETALVGIHTGGVWLARRLHEALGLAVPVGEIDVAFYRDDFKQRGLKPGVRPSELPFDVNGRNVILVDDVLYTGRTVRAALNVLFDYGRPGSVSLAALVDRGGRQLPICAQYLGGLLMLEAGAPMLVLGRGENGRLALAYAEDAVAT
ncbi:MAG: bifunctional pyr operon transcriptional regulator/uracil phosphoribosyltransferase PyrR [Burkholderiales bacterium]